MIPIVCYDGVVEVMTWAIKANAVFGINSILRRTLQKNEKATMCPNNMTNVAAETARSIKSYILYNPNYKPEIRQHQTER